MSKDVSAQQTPSQRLVAMLEFDPSKRSPTADAFKTAKKKIEAEREAKLVEGVEATLRRGMDLHEQLCKIDKEYTATRKKISDELGKVMNSLQNIGRSDASADTNDEPPAAEAAAPAVAQQA